MGSSADIAETESRATSRTHMFVAATIYVDAGNRGRPVRVRNMSSTGALIDGHDVPNAGQLLTLRRGSLAADGQVAWKIGSKAGVSFAAPVDVKRWLANVGTAQARVDLMVAEIKDSRRSKATKISPAVGLVEFDAVSQLRQVRANLNRLALVLAQDAAVRGNHPEIQVLDMSLHQLDQIVEKLNGSD